MSRVDVITEEERRLIDEALAAGRVTKCPTGAMATMPELKYDPVKNRILPVNGSQTMQPMRFFGGTKGATQAKIAFDRRNKVKTLMQEGHTQVEMANMLGVGLATISRDVRVLKGEA